MFLVILCVYFYYAVNIQCLYERKWEPRCPENIWGRLVPGPVGHNICAALTITIGEEYPTAVYNYGTGVRYPKTTRWIQWRLRVAGHREWRQYMRTGGLMGEFCKCRLYGSQPRLFPGVGMKLGLGRAGGSLPVSSSGQRRVECLCCWTTGHWLTKAGYSIIVGLRSRFPAGVVDIIVLLDCWWYRRYFCGRTKNNALSSVS